MDKQRWEEMLREEGYSQHAIDSLWKDKPDFIKIEEMSEEALRESNRMMMRLYPEWATRESDDKFLEGDK